MLDLLNIAKTEADGNDLLKLISSLYKSSDIRPKGYPNAIVWEGGNFDKNINPIAHSLTDAYALLGTIAAIDVLNLPFFFLSFIIFETASLPTLFIADNA